MAINVLVVDDSAVMRAMIVRTLRLTHLPIQEVHESANGREALTVLDDHWVDLALVDINMPVMDGEELIMRVRDDPALGDLPILVVSTEGSATRIARLKERGVRFLHKPFTPESLRDEVFLLTGLRNDESIASGGDADF